MMLLPVPFVVYWLIVKDFFSNLDYCDNNSTETGYCMSDLQCSNIVNGTVIGSCDSEASGQVCCHITVNYYNETYYLKPLFAGKNPTDKPQKVMLFNSGMYDLLTIDYGNTRISSKKRTNLIFFDERVHVCVSPDRIIWPIIASYSRESRDLKIKSPFSGTSYLYVVTLNKIHDENEEKRNSTLECLSKVKEVDASKPGEDERLDFYLKVNGEVKFPLRKFFTPEIQSLKKTNFTDDIESLFQEPKLQERSRRSTKYSTCKEADSIFEKQPSENSENLDKPDQLDNTVPSQSTVGYDIQLENDILNIGNLKAEDNSKNSMLDYNRNFQKSVQTDSTHDMRKPVETEVTHDMRTPVSMDDSHDLRWPIIEEESDLRNVYIERDIFQDNHMKDITKNSDKLSAPTLLDCETKFSFRNKNSGIENPYKERKFNDVWKDSLKVCGKFSEETQDFLRTISDRKWPWMVSLLEKKSGKFRNKCSASLLNSLWVLTVAHCVDMKYKSDFKLHLGNKNIDSDTESITEVEIDEIIMHPDFNRGMLENDLALLRMKIPVEFQPDILPICLPSNSEEVKIGTPVFLGWEYKQNSETLQNLTAPLMTNYECEMLYAVGKNQEKIKDTFLCAGKNDGNCDSESGSSLIALNSEGRWSLIGLVSWGSMCSNLDQPTVYVRISSYIKWIKDVIDCYEILM